MSSNSSNTVWLFIDSLNFGGIETHVLELAKGLSSHNVACKVWFLKHYPKESVLAAKLKQYNIDYCYLDLTDQHWLINLRYQVLSHRPDVLHAHGYKASLACKLIRYTSLRTPLFSRQKKLKQLSTYHAGETPTGRVWFYDFLDRLSVRLSDNAISVSDKIAQKLYGHSYVLNNFIDTSRIEFNKEDKQIAFVGRLSEEKAPDRFIELADNNPQHKFHLYGDGPMSSRLKELCPNNAILHGHQDDMDRVWDKIDILILCSRYEGLPMTAIEAMARGITVISLDVGDVYKLIDHEKSGYVVATMNELNTTLNHYLNLPQPLCFQLQQNAIATVNNRYSQQAVIPQMLSIYFNSGGQCDSHNEKLTVHKTETR